MALVKKGSRSITVDGVTYRWRVRRRATYAQALGWSPLSYAVEQADLPGTTLVVTTNQPHPGNLRELPASPVLLAHVSDAIRAARAKGWVSEEPGPPFLLDQSAGYISPG
jgi:hypothetical protein